ncbi:ATP-binding protein [Promicromonospora soli]
MTVIDIQPPSDVYDTFGRLNYKAWYAIAEFVDNATQNAFDNDRQLRAAKGRSGPLVHIRVTHNTDRVVVVDDAHGMNLEEIKRAVRLNAPPPDKSGRSEFGMGLKTAACWFGRHWTITSSQLGNPVEYSVTFDLDKFVNGNVTNVEVVERRVDPADHGTTLVITNLRNPLRGRGVEVLKKSLTSMYRQDLRSGRVAIDLNNTRLQYTDPELHLETLPDGREQTWRKEFSVEVVDQHRGDTHHVRGWIGIRKVMSRKETGFALLRRGRLIIGGYDSGWRPDALFGQAGGFRWGRLVGELHCDSFPVNFSKDGFAWEGGLEDALIDALEPELREYGHKAQNIRKDQKEPTTADLVKVLHETQERLTESTLVRDLAKLETVTADSADRVADAEAREQLVEQSDVPVELKVPIPGGRFLVARLAWQNGRRDDAWMFPSFAQEDEVDVFLNKAHPFVEAAVADETSLRLLCHFALSTALAEKRARYVSGENVRPDDLRTHLDTFLRHSAPNHPVG